MTFACLALLQLAAIPISQARAAELSFADFPFLITCEAGGTQYAYYLSRLKFRFEDRAVLQCSRCFAVLWLSGF